MPRIGIFWVYGGMVLGRAVELAAGEEGVPGLLDSPDNHADLWEQDPKLLATFPALRGREYFAVPRGRVLWKLDGPRAIVYADAKLLNPATRRKIVAFFGLEAIDVSWITDPHYSQRQV